MTDDYSKFSEDDRWIQITYTKFMENSQSLNTRLNV